MEYRFKIGDKVKVKSVDWYNKNKGVFGDVELKTQVFLKDMSVFCGDTVTISGYVTNPYVEMYFIREDPEKWCWSPEMFE